MDFERQYSSAWESYELLDAGGGKKLERFGDVITIRPELQAYFKSEWPFEEWYNLAHWEFVELSKAKGSKILKSFRVHRRGISSRKINWRNRFSCRFSETINHLGK